MQELAIYPNIEGRERVIDLTLILKNRFRINEEAIREQKRTNIILVQDEITTSNYSYSALRSDLSAYWTICSTMRPKQSLNRGENLRSGATVPTTWPVSKSGTQAGYLKKR